VSNPITIRETPEGYYVELPEPDIATEDLAMTVGAEFRTSVLFNRYRIAPSLSNLRFYRELPLLVPYRRGGKMSWIDTADSSFIWKVVLPALQDVPNTPASVPGLQSC